MISCCSLCRRVIGDYHSPQCSLHGMLVTQYHTELTDTNQKRFMLVIPAEKSCSLTTSPPSKRTPKSDDTDY